MKKPQPDTYAVARFVLIVFVVILSIYLLAAHNSSFSSKTTANNDKQSVFIDSYKKNPVDRFSVELEQLEQSIKYNETVKVLIELRPKLLARATELEQTKLDYQLNLAKTKEQIQRTRIGLSC